jgi:proteasome lid subunit RPN8/RPN11
MKSCDPEDDLLMSVSIRSNDLSQIRTHGESAFPHECCGILLGRLDSSGKVVERIEALQNERSESRHNRFLISPETLLKAERTARAEGLDVIGFYHSHPDHPARPSEFDREHAWPTYSYVIISVLKGVGDEILSWTLAEDRTRFNEENIVTALEV